MKNPSRSRALVGNKPFHLLSGFLRRRFPSRCLQAIPGIFFAQGVLQGLRATTPHLAVEHVGQAIS
jgi:hypothetical protein